MTLRLDLFTDSSDTIAKLAREVSLIKFTLLNIDKKLNILLGERASLGPIETFQLDPMTTIAEFENFDSGLTPERKIEVVNFFNFFSRPICVLIYISEALPDEDWRSDIQRRVEGNAAEVVQG